MCRLFVVILHFLSTPNLIHQNLLTRIHFTLHAGTDTVTRYGHVHLQPPLNLVIHAPQQPYHLRLGHVSMDVHYHQATVVNVYAKWSLQTNFISLSFICISVFYKYHELN